jgi:hypothetical protein
LRPRSHYLTVRCPTGCEAWLHPRALQAHLARCALRPWTDAVSDSTLVAAPLADVLRAALPAALCERPTFSGDRVLKPGPSEYLYPELLHGVIVLPRSPAFRREHGGSSSRQACDGTATKRSDAQ